MRLPLLASALLATAGCSSLAPFDQALLEPVEETGEEDACEAVRCQPETGCVAGVCVSRGPCADVRCDAPLVCSAGQCVSPNLDEDYDGYPVTSDCDDHDRDVIPGSTAPCSTACGEGTSTCEDGTWQPCTAPAVCSCTPGESTSESCEYCGTRTRLCGDAGVWEEAGPCSAEGACSPGDQDTQPCGNCGTQARTCDATCQWGAYETCAGEGPCSPGQAEAETCGNCGTRSRTCQADCQWSAYGTCAGEGCAPGTTDTQGCGNCGRQDRTCSASCQWTTSGECSGEGSCTPGAQTPCVTGCPGADTCTPACESDAHCCTCTTLLGDLVCQGGVGYFPCGVAGCHVCTCGNGCDVQSCTACEDPCASL